MKFAAFGRTRWLYDGVLRARERGHEPVLIGTCAASAESTRRERDFEDLARSIGCPFFADHRINDPRYLELVRASEARAAITVNWLTLIGAEMIRQFPLGIVNAHAGDLPRYRGNACPNWAILEGEAKVVLSLHKVVPELDAGPVLAKRELPLADDTYVTDVYRFLDQAIPEMFAEVLDDLASGSTQELAQPADPGQSLRCFPRAPNDHRVDWSASAERIARLVRASAEPFSGAFTFLEDGRRLRIWRARAAHLKYPHLGVPGQVASIDRGSGEVSVLAGDGTVVLEEVGEDAGWRGRPSEVIRSTRTRLGLDVHAEIERLRAEVANLRRALEARHR